MTIKEQIKAKFGTIQRGCRIIGVSEPTAYNVERSGKVSKNTYKLLEQAGIDVSAITIKHTYKLTQSDRSKGHKTQAKKRASKPRYPAYKDRPDTWSRTEAEINASVEKAFANQKPPPVATHEVDGEPVNWTSGLEQIKARARG